MAILEEVTEDEVFQTATEDAGPEPPANISDMIGRLQVPEVLLGVGRTSSWPASALQAYHRESVRVLQALELSLGADQGEHGINSEEEQRTAVLLCLLRLNGQDEWLDPQAGRLLKAILELPLLQPPGTLPLHILTNILRPIFCPHPSLSLTTSRALPRLAGGDKAMQDLFDGDVQEGWKGREGWGVWNLLGWCLGYMDAISVKNNIGLILPPMLTMMDDYEPLFRLRGMRILDRFLIKVDSGTMKRMGIDKLFIKSLQHSLSLHPLPPTPPILCTALPLLIRLSHLSTAAQPTARAEIIAEAVDKGIINGWHYTPTSMAGLPELVGIAKGVEMVCEEVGFMVVRWLKTFIPALTAPCLLPPSPYATQLQIANLHALSVLLRTIEKTGRAGRWRGEILNGVGRAFIGADDAILLKGNLRKNDGSDLRKVQDLCVEIVKLLVNVTPSIREEELHKMSGLNAAFERMALLI